jgi:hypothetical protein
MSIDTQTTTQATIAPKVVFWISWLFSGLFVAFMLFDSIIKLMKIDAVVAAMQSLGYPVGLARGLGALELLLTVLYVIPRTSIAGAILLTGLFGGAMASHVRLEHPLFSHVLFGVYLALFAWGGLYLRDARVRSVFPLRT